MNRRDVNRRPRGRRQGRPEQRVPRRRIVRRRRCKRRVWSIPLRQLCRCAPLASRAVVVRVVRERERLEGGGGCGGELLRRRRQQVVDRVHRRRRRRGRGPSALDVVRRRGGMDVYGAAHGRRPRYPRRAVRVSIHALPERPRLRVYPRFDRLHLLHAVLHLGEIRGVSRLVSGRAPVSVLAHGLHHEGAEGHEDAEELLVVALVPVDLSLRAWMGGRRGERETRCGSSRIWGGSRVPSARIWEADGGGGRAP